MMHEEIDPYGFNNQTLTKCIMQDHNYIVLKLNYNTISVFWI